MSLRDCESLEFQVIVGRSDTRPRLRAALLDVLAETPMRAVTQRDLAARAGIAAPRFGEFYRDVDECVLDTFDRLAEDLLAQFAQAFDVPGDWHERFVNAIDESLLWLLRSPGAMRLWFLEARRTSDGELLAHRNEARERLIDIVTDPREGVVLDVPELHVEFLFGALSHAAYDELAAGGDGASAGRRLRELLVLFEPIAA